MRNSRANRIDYRPPSGSPAPLCCSVKRRVALHEVDPLQVVWFGRYATFFDEAVAALGRQCGLSYQAYQEAGLLAHVYDFHVQYLEPLHLDQEFEARCTILWGEAARLDYRFEIRTGQGSVATRAQCVVLLLDAESKQVCYVPPELIVTCRERWTRGDVKCLQEAS